MLRVPVLASAGEVLIPVLPRTRIAVDQLQLLTWLYLVARAIRQLGKDVSPRLAQIVSRFVMRWPWVLSVGKSRKG